MPAYGPNIDVVANTVTARAALAAAAAKVADMRPAMQIVKEILIRGNKEAWETRGASLGVPWKPNAAETLSRKAREGQPARPLEASGALKTAIYGGKGRYSRASKGMVRVGVRLFYAKFHLGESGRLPRRPMLGISKKTEQAALVALQRYLGL